MLCLNQGSPNTQESNFVARKLLEAITSDAREKASGTARTSNEDFASMQTRVATSD